MAAAVCIQGRSQTGSHQSQSWIVLPVYAYHLDRGIYCNDKAAGIGLERAKSEHDRAQVAVFRNSNCEWSVEAVKCWLPFSVLSVRAGGCAGGVTGYGTAVLPAGAFVATYERKSWGINLIVVPPFGDASPGVLWWQLKKPW
jgi:hypothetical protein